MAKAEFNPTTPRVVTIACLCLLAVGCNVVLPSLFWDAIDSGGIAESFMCVACGALVAQACLLGIWCGLSQQAIKYRLPVTAALVLIGACSYTLGLRLPDRGSPDNGIPLEAVLVVVGAAFGMFTLLQIPLWLFRRSTQCRIAIPETAQFEDSLKGSQFGVGYLMLWTALVGVLLVLVRNILPEHSDGVSARELTEIVMAILVYIGLSSLLCIPCIGITLAERPHLGSMLILAGVLIAGPVFVLGSTNMIFGIQNTERLLTGVASYEAGLTGTSLAVLLVLRLLGYRVPVVASRSILSGPNSQLGELHD